MRELLFQFQKVAMLAFFVSSMAGMGMTLTPQAMIAPLKNFRLVLIALALNFILSPALAWVLTVLIPLEPGHAIGLLLLGGAAGAPFLPKLVENARGDAGIAVALMGLLTLGTLLFLPFALPMLIPGLRVDAWSIARPIVYLIVLPLLIGMMIRGGAASVAARLSPIFGKVGSASLLLLIVLLISLNVQALLGVVGSGAILATLLYLVGLLAASWLACRGEAQSRGILTLATTARNFGAAIAAAASFSDPKVMIMLIVGTIVCIAVAFPAAGWMRRRSSSP